MARIISPTFCKFHIFCLKKRQIQNSWGGNRRFKMFPWTTAMWAVFKIIGPPQKKNNKWSSGGAKKLKPYLQKKIPQMFKKHGNF